MTIVPETDSCRTIPSLGGADWMPPEGPVGPIAVSGASLNVCIDIFMTGGILLVYGLTSKVLLTHGYLLQITVITTGP
jgi:hypothetical protein